MSDTKPTVLSRNFDWINQAVDVLYVCTYYIEKKQYFLTK